MAIPFATARRDEGAPARGCCRVPEVLSRKETAPEGAASSGSVVDGIA